MIFFDFTNIQPSHYPQTHLLPALPLQHALQTPPSNVLFVHPAQLLLLPLLLGGTALLNNLQCPIGGQTSKIRITIKIKTKLMQMNRKRTMRKWVHLLVRWIVWRIWSLQSGEAILILMLEVDHILFCLSNVYLIDLLSFIVEHTLRKEIQDEYYYNSYHKPFPFTSSEQVQVQLLYLFIA